MSIDFEGDKLHPWDRLKVKDTVEEEALRDFVGYLERLHAVQIAPASSKPSDEQSVDVYKITGTIDKVPDLPSFYIKEEKEFLQAYATFQSVAIAIANLYEKHVEKRSNAFSSIKNFELYRDQVLGNILKDQIGIDLSYENQLLNPVYDNLKRVPPRGYSREALITPINIALSLPGRLLDDFVLVIKSILSVIHTDLSVQLSSISDISQKLNIKFPMPQKDLEKDRVLLVESPKMTKKLLIITYSASQTIQALSKTTEDQNDVYMLALQPSWSSDFDLTELWSQPPSVTLDGSRRTLNIDILNSQNVFEIVDLWCSSSLRQIPSTNVSDTYEKSRLTQKQYKQLGYEFWVTLPQPGYKIHETGGYRQIEIDGEDILQDWDNCSVTVHKILPNGKITLIVRSINSLQSEYLGTRPAKIRQMITIECGSISEPREEKYKEPLSNNPKMYGEDRIRWVLSLDDKYFIWQWARAEGDIRSSSIQALYSMLENRRKLVEAARESNIIIDNDIATNQPDPQIPVIYQPAISELANFLREIHCHPRHNSDNSVDLEVSLIFNSEELKRHRLANRLYEAQRRIFYGRVIEIETFWIHLSMSNIYENYFRFENIYSGSYGIEKDSIHLTSETRPIVYYFKNTNHPIVFINTSNHAMGETDNNPSFWKWEYVPWIADAPIILGNKSRQELDSSFKPIVRFY